MKDEEQLFDPSRFLPMVQRALALPWDEYEVIRFERIESIDLITKFSMLADVQAKLAQYKDLRNGSRCFEANHGLIRGRGLVGEGYNSLPIDSVFTSAVSGDHSNITGTRVERSRCKSPGP